MRRKEATNTPGKMEVLTLLLVLFTVSGYAFVLQPRPTVRQIAELERETLPGMEGKQLNDVSISVEGKEKTGHYSDRRKTEKERRNEGPTPETNPEKTEEKLSAGSAGSAAEVNKGYEEGNEDRLTPETLAEMLAEETKRDTEKDLVWIEDFKTDEEGEKVKEILVDNTKTREAIETLGSHDTWIKEKDDESLQKLKRSEGVDEARLEIEEEESELVAGLHLNVEARGDDLKGGEKEEEKGGNEEREEEGESRKNAGRNGSVERGKEDLVRNLTRSSYNGHHDVSSSLLVTPTQVPLTSHRPPTPHDKVSPPFFPPSVRISVTTVAPGEARSPFGDLLTEVLPSPGHQLKQNELEGNPGLEDAMVTNVLFKPAQRERQTTRGITAVQPEEAEFIPKVQAAARKPTEVKFISKDLRAEGSNSSSKANAELAHELHVTRRTGKPKTGELLENDTKRNKTQQTAARMHVKSNRRGQNKTNKKPKEKKRKNKTQKLPEKKAVVTPTHFPYFLDNYCPPECACYGRVVQCSDKGVDKVPYGIPYNARYILLMNNHIDSIQLDLLNEYVSMEFLVLSNNRLTDSSIEGAFEGIPALKRLYLDRNLLDSVPTDLPVSLEELRLDNNRLSVMSEAAWARCPGLLVLSLSNNSLGNGSDSLPNAVLSPLSSLRTLNLDHNQLTSVPRGLPLSIKELYLKGNLIEQFRGGAFNGVSEVVLLDLSANRLTNKGLLSESLLNATHLESLNLQGNKLKKVPRHLPCSLKTLNLEGNLISSIKKAALSSLKNLEHLGLARNKIIKVAPGAFKALPVLHQLDLCHNALRQVPRQLPQALHSVALTHNKIRSVARDAFCWGDKSLSLSRLIRVQLEHNLIDMGKLDVQPFRCLRGFQVVHFY